MYVITHLAWKGVLNVSLVKLAFIRMKLVVSFVWNVLLVAIATELEWQCVQSVLMDITASKVD